MISEEIKRKFKLPYSDLAEKYNTSYEYVAKIAIGERNPTRGKGLLIKLDLQEIFSK